MLRPLFYTGLVLGFIGLGVFWFITAPQQLSADELPTHTASVEAGSYIFSAAGCASCHAAPGAKGEDKLTLAGGKRFETEFGTFIAPNISPDKSAGIGAWSPLEFANAVTRGVSPNGSHYYPAFPYGSYRQAKLADVLDLKAYMDTLPAVTDPAPANEVSFPFNVRRGLGLWKLLFLDSETFTDDPSVSAEVNRGAYLVNALGHCAECHTPRNLLGGINHDNAFAGAPNPDGKGFIPNITPHADGIGSWTAEDIAYALESGFTPEFDSLGGSMTAVVDNTSKLTAEDRSAMAAYLKTVAEHPRTSTN